MGTTVQLYLLLFLGGVRGVFDIEDLVHVLQIENAEDIFVAEVPPEIKYIEHICLVNGKSQKHMQAIIQFVRKVYKQKRNDGDVIPRTEGGESKDWIALDLGNIALHVFSKRQGDCMTWTCCGL